MSDAVAVSTCITELGCHAVRMLGHAVALTFFRSLKTFRLAFLRMRDICKIINV